MFLLVVPYNPTMHLTILPINTYYHPLPALYLKQVQPLRYIIKQQETTIQSGFILWVLNNSFIINWNVAKDVSHPTGGTDTSIEFAISFTTAVLGVVTSNPPLAAYAVKVVPSSITVSGCDLASGRTSGSSANTYTYFILSYGY